MITKPQRWEILPWTSGQCYYPSTMATRKSTRKPTRKSTRQVSTYTITKLSGTNDIIEKTTGKAEGSQHGKTSTEKDVSSQDLVPINEKTNGKTRDWFTFIPLDVCLEIFKLLEPVDLLHISRVSKRLQEFLTSNNMVSLWKSVGFLGFLRQLHI